jgi:hypothetical protein
MTCKCGMEARFICNGQSQALNYWYCDTCKDIPTASLSPDDSWEQLSFSKVSTPSSSPSTGAIYYTLDPVTGNGHFVDADGNPIDYSSSLVFY